MVPKSGESRFIGESWQRSMPRRLTRAFAVCTHKYGSRRRVWPKIRHLAPLDGCACAFEELSLQRTKSTIISWDGSFSGVMFFCSSTWCRSRVWHSLEILPFVDCIWATSWQNQQNDYVPRASTQSGQLMAKECALGTGKLPRRLAQGQYG